MPVIQDNVLVAAVLSILIICLTIGYVMNCYFSSKVETKSISKSKNDIDSILEKNHMPTWTHETKTTTYKENKDV